MPIIYEPRGKAWEYSDLAVNLYTGCSHACRYCYCPAILRKTIDAWAFDPQPRKGILRDLERDAKKLRGDPREILLSFISENVIMKSQRCESGSSLHGTTLSHILLRSEGKPRNLSTSLTPKSASSVPGSRRASPRSSSWRSRAPGAHSPGETCGRQGQRLAASRPALP